MNCLKGVEDGQNMVVANNNLVPSMSKKLDNMVGFFCVCVPRIKIMSKNLPIVLNYAPVRIIYLKVTYFAKIIRWHISLWPSPNRITIQHSKNTF